MRRISMLWFWITPATCISSIFFFAFGVSALSYFMTGQENVDIWTVLNILQALPDPREFITGSMKIFNNFNDAAQKIKYFSLDDVLGSNVLRAIANGVVSILRGFITILGFVGTLVVSFVTFPVYCVFFTIRSCSAMLALINVEVPYNLTNMSWDTLFNNI